MSQDQDSGSADDTVTEAVVFHFPGITLNEGAMREVRQHFVRSAQESGAVDLHLSLAVVQFTTPGGLGGLVALDIAIRHAGGRLTVCDVSPGIYEMMRLARLNLVLDVRAPGNLSGRRPRLERV